MPAASGHCPLAELQSWIFHPGILIFPSLNVLNAHDGAYFGFQIRRYPLVDRLQSRGVKIAVDSALGLQKHVAQEVGTQRGYAQGEERVKDLSAVGVMFQRKSIGADGGDERVLVILIFGDPGLDGVGVGVDGSVVEEDLPYLIRDSI